MKLEDLLRFREIVIQCHDNPDADALASGYGLFTYFRQNGKNVRLVYGGANAVSKRNLKLMTDLCRIPARHVQRLKAPELLLYVDCQPGESNVQDFPARTTAVIDHHRVAPNKKLPELQRIHSNYGSCSTIVWQMLEEAGYQVNDNPDLAAALYYGLYTDTGRLQEISHPMDKDMRDYLNVSPSVITLFQNSNLSLRELEIASQALAGYHFDSRYHFALIDAEACDPNILGVISDMMLEVDVVRTCVAYCILNGGVKFSVRSCVKETRANELAEFLADGIGNGGGHARKAGGFLNGASLFPKRGNADRIHSDVFHLLNRKMKEYFRAEKVVHAGAGHYDWTQAPIYRKKRVSVGYVPSAEMFPPETPVMVRMLEGDFEFNRKEDYFLMIGTSHEVYTCSKEVFAKNYEATQEPYVMEQNYRSFVKNLQTGEKIDLASHAKACIPKETSLVYASRLEETIKLFPLWDQENYMLGRPGDWIVAQKENPKDIYIVKEDIFDRLYEAV